MSSSGKGHGRILGVIALSVMPVSEPPFGGRFGGAVPVPGRCPEKLSACGVSSHGQKVAVVLGVRWPHLCILKEEVRSLLSGVQMR